MKKTFKRFLAGFMACAMTLGISAVAVADRPTTTFNLSGYSNIIGSVSYTTYNPNTVVFTAKTRSADSRAIPTLTAGLIISNIENGGVIYTTSGDNHDKNSYSISTYGMTQKPMVATGKHNARNSQEVPALKEDATTFIVFDPEE